MDFFFLAAYIAAHYILLLLCALGVFIRFVIFLGSLFTKASQTMKDFFHLWISLFYFISLNNFIIQEDKALILFFITLGFQFYVEVAHPLRKGSSNVNTIVRIVNSRIVKLTWCITLLVVAFVYKSQN